MKKFKGYYIIGCASKQNAKDKKGLVLWSELVPSKFVQFFDRVLLNIYWINEERTQTIQKTENATLTRNLPDTIKK
jgi:hypothetical protein